MLWYRLMSDVSKVTVRGGKYNSALCSLHGTRVRASAPVACGGFRARDP